jgi:hypothetical protein
MRWGWMLQTLKTWMAPNEQVHHRKWHTSIWEELEGTISDCRPCRSDVSGLRVRVEHVVLRHTQTIKSSRNLRNGFFELSEINTCSHWVRRTSLISSGDLPVDDFGHFDSNGVLSLDPKIFILITVSKQNTISATVSMPLNDMEITKKGIVFTSVPKRWQWLSDCILEVRTAR